MNKNIIKRTVLSIGACAMLTACGVGGGGGGGSSTPPASTTLEGTFTDSAVDGLTYIINGVSKTTSNGGKYQYKSGDSVTFKLGNLTLGTVTGKATVTPLDMFEGNVTIFDTRVINMGRILQTYDSDNNPDNGITLEAQIANNSVTDVNWSDETSVTNFNTNMPTPKGLRTKAQSLSHLKQHIPNSNDPLMKYQWYLDASNAIAMNSSGVVPQGNDLNISDVWDLYTGENNGSAIKIQVVDNGVDTRHEDLINNIDTVNAYSFNTSDNNVLPTSLSTDSHAHGTKCAGIAAAEGWNGKGIRGVAPNAKIVPFKLKTQVDQMGESFVINEEVIDKAWVTNPDANNIHVSSNSWGTCFDQAEYFETVLSTGTSTLRDGKGRVYVVTSGNDRKNGCRTAGGETSANGSRMKNNSHVVTVAALNHKDEYAYYSQGGANVLVSAYGGTLDSAGPSLATTTTKESNSAKPFTEDTVGNYTTFQGTSAAAPIVSGAIALTLEACPTLSYRDIQYIIAKTSKKVDATNKRQVAKQCDTLSGCSSESDYSHYNIYRKSSGEMVFNNGAEVININTSSRRVTSGEPTVFEEFKVIDGMYQRGYRTQSNANVNLWQTNGAGLDFNPNYGFGKIDVGAMINMCKNGYTPLGTEQTFTSNVINITDGTGVGYNITSTNIISVPNNFKARWVGVDVNWTNTIKNDDTEIVLTSPSGTKLLIDPFNDNFSTDTNRTISYGAYGYMDESVTGDWNLTIKGAGNTYDNDTTVKLTIKGY
jgi:subtilisin family serine protease